MARQRYQPPQPVWRNILLPIVQWIGLAAIFVGLALLIAGEVRPPTVTGPVEDFCLVVAQRRNIADTDLVVNGEVARHWMQIAQVFAGPPGPGREPTGRPVPRQPPPDAL